jgi:hypothetical protein
VGDEGGATRRQFLQVTTATAVAAVALRSEVSEARAPRFFTREEFAIVDELSELIIPTDAHSRGARAAGVAAYIDARLGESFEDAPRQEWREGIHRLDELSREMHGHALMSATHGERIALLERISANEDTGMSPAVQRQPPLPEEAFFETLKGATCQAYYTSRIGIHDELEYKGNVYLQEFIGIKIE